MTTGGLLGARSGSPPARSPAGPAAGVGTAASAAAAATPDVARPVSALAAPVLSVMRAIPLSRRCRPLPCGHFTGFTFANTPISLTIAQPRPAHLRAVDHTGRARENPLVTAPRRWRRGREEARCRASRAGPPPLPGGR